MTAVLPGTRGKCGHARVGIDRRRRGDHHWNRVIELRAVTNGPAYLHRIHVGEGFIQYQKIVIRESCQLEGLGARARVSDDVPVLLEYALQSPTHPIVSAGDQSKGRAIQG